MGSPIGIMRAAKTLMSFAHSRILYNVSVFERFSVDDLQPWNGCHAFEEFSVQNVLCLSNVLGCTEHHYQ